MCRSGVALPVDARNEPPSFVEPRRPVAAEVLVGGDDVRRVARELGLVGVALGCLGEPGLLEELRIDRREIRVGDVRRVLRIRDVENHVAGVPVRDEHQEAAADLLHDHVVMEDLDEIRRAVLEDLRELPVEVVLGDHRRLLGVRDVDDVDVRPLLVVDDDGIRLRSGVPREDAVDLVRVLLALPP